MEHFSQIIIVPVPRIDTDMKSHCLAKPQRSSVLIIEFVFHIRNNQSIPKYQVLSTTGLVESPKRVSWHETGL